MLRRILVVLTLIAVALFPSYRAFAAGAPALQVAQTGDTPVHVLKVYGGFMDPSSGDYDMRVGVSFENVSAKTIVAVKWHIGLIDDFGKVLWVDTEISRGTFSPNVVIDPKRALDGALQTASEFGNTNAWDFENPYGNKVAQYRVQAAAVRFQDGTIWENPVAQRYP